MDNGCIVIGNIITRASAEVIGKLKSILDRHGIYHIIDGVMFYDPQRKAARMQAIHQGRATTADKPQSNFYLKTRGLIVPDLYELNYMSLMDFNSEEADFLSTLIFGED